MARDQSIGDCDRRHAVSLRMKPLNTEPRVRYLLDLLQDIERGDIQVPRFQRPLVWDVERQLELLRSIRAGIPIGALMIWQTNNEEVGYYRQLGPHKLAAPRANMPRSYLLDGVQRLSTLYGALYLTRPAQDLATFRAGEGADLHDFYFDFDEDDFIALKRGYQSHQLELFESGNRFPLRYLLDRKALRRFERSLDGQVEPWSERVDARIDELIEAFKHCRMAVIYVASDDLTLVTRTFQRINSQGVVMTEMHMIHALTYSAKFDLRRKLHELREEWLLPVGWKELDDDFILMACKALLGLDMYEADISTFSQQLADQPQTLARAVRGLRQAIDFLRERCGVWDFALLPHRSQVLMIAEGLRVTDAQKEEAQELLEAWFWLSGHGSLFSGTSARRVQYTLAEIREMVRGNVLRWTGHTEFRALPLPETFSLKSARAKVLLLQLILRHVQRNGRRAPAVLGRHIVTRLMATDRFTRQESSASVGNIVIIQPELLNDWREQFLHGDLSDEALDDHVIPHLAYAAFCRGTMNADEFIDARFGALEAMDEAQLEAILRRYEIM